MKFSQIGLCKNVQLVPSAAIEPQFKDQNRCDIHPDADGQGIYLVLWFGPDEKVAERIRHGISSADELKTAVESKLPVDLIGRIEVFVLNVSKSPKDKLGKLELH